MRLSNAMSAYTFYTETYLDTKVETIYRPDQLFATE